MVFFTCNACGQSIKKNKVEKHYQVECRSCEILSCMDCGKEFAGDEYLSHTSCISEAEKYQGALYSESNKGQPKGEKKQQEWLERIRKSVSSVATNPRIANLLERIADYPNIPRKKPKFVNFVRNSLCVRDDRTLDQLWDAFNTTTKPPSSDSQSTGGGQKAEAKECVGGEQGSQAKVSDVNDEKDKEQKPSKKQKHMGAEDVKETESEETSFDKCKQVDQEQSTATAPSGDSHGNMEMETAGKTTLNKKKKKKADKLERIESNEVTEAVSCVVEEPPKKRSKKTKAADSSDQKECTAEMLVDTESKMANKYNKHESQDNAGSEGCLVVQESEGQSFKKKRKLNSAATQNCDNTNEQDGCCGNIEAMAPLPATGEDGTTAVLRNAKKKEKNSLVMESIEVTEAKSNVVDGPPKKKFKKVKATGDNCGQKVTVPSTMSQWNSESKVAKSQDSTSGEGDVVIEKGNSQTSKKKKKRKHDL